MIRHRLVGLALKEFVLLICAGFMVTILPSAATAAPTLLRCEPLSEFVAVEEWYEIIKIDLEEDSIVTTEYRSSGISSRSFFLLQVTDRAITGFGFNDNGEPNRIEIDRTSGYARFDSRVADKDKPNVWDEKRQRIGVPITEELWLGYSLQCSVARSLF